MALGVMVKAGATVRSRAMFYKLLVHAVILYGRNNWVITDLMMKVLEGFHHRAVWRIVGNKNRSVGSEGYECPPTED